jgi:diguanylate cyclase
MSAPLPSTPKQPRFSSEARRALAWTGWLSVLLTIVSFVSLDMWLTYHDGKSRAETIAQVVASSAVGAVAFRDDAGAERLLASLVATDEIIEAKILDKAGRRIGQPFTQTPTEHAGWTRLIPVVLHDNAKADIIYDKEKLGEVHLRIRHQHMTEHLAFVPLLGVGLLALAAFLISRFSRTLQLKLAGPLDDLLSTTQRIRENNNFALRAPKSSIQEFDALSNDFNGLLSEIETRSKELEASNKALARLAYTDGLSGLANRARFRQRVQELLNNAAPPLQPFAIALLDLDGFKPVNDQCGHLVGDDVLVSVARALERVIGPTDLLARVGGDEFAVLIHPIDDRLPHELAERAVEAVARGAGRVTPASLRVTASVGLAFFPEHGTTLDALLASADAAMYNAKGDGGARAHTLPTTTTRMDARVPPNSK